MSQRLSREKKKIIFDKGSGILPKSLFIGFALSGALIVWVMKYFGVSQFITVFIPISFIVLYCYLATRVDSFFLTEEKIGDNAYYLGFLYTLSSLAYALLMFSNGNNAPEYIIGSFGVALWSTIVGIACRVFFSQLRHDPNDIEKNARIRVSETANNLASELYQASVEFNSYRRSLQQSLEEAFINLNEKMDGHISASCTKINEAANNIADGINNKYAVLDETITQISNSAKKTADSFDKMNKDIDSSGLSINTAVTNLVTVINQQAYETQNSNQQLARMLKDLSMLSNKISELTQNSSGVFMLNKDLIDVSNNIQNLFKSFSSGLQTMTEEQRQVLKKISDHANALEAQLERSRQYTNDTHQSLALMTRNITEKLG